MNEKSLFYDNLVVKRIGQVHLSVKLLLYSVANGYYFIRPLKFVSFNVPAFSNELLKISFTLTSFQDDFMIIKSQPISSISIAFVRVYEHYGLRGASIKIQHSPSAVKLFHSSMTIYQDALLTYLPTYLLT